MKEVRKFYWIIAVFALTYSYSFSQHKKITVGSVSPISEKPIDNRYAFIVGIDHYKDESISNLSSCRLDAVRFSSFLKSNSNWRLPKNRIKLLLDPDNESFKTSFLDLLDGIVAPDTSTLYFYYSGHGVNGGMVPTDFEKTTLDKLISYDWVKQEIASRSIKAIVLILDACYSGSIVDTKNVVSFDENYFQAFPEDGKFQNYVIFTATNAYRVTPAGTHESMYTRQFLDALEDHDSDSDTNGILSSYELSEAIKNKVGTANTPQFYGSKDFPMALLSHTNFNSIERSTSKRMQASENSSYTNSNFISWRKRLDRIKNNKEILQKMIETLRSSENAEAYARLGYLYREGIGVKKDINFAITKFITAAEEENAFAQYNMGYMYANGIGFNQDTQRAIRYYRMAADKGHPYALYNLGAAFAKPTNGLLPYDFERANKWLKKAAHYEIPSVYFSIGSLYDYEATQHVEIEKVKKLKKEAFKWHLKASTNNHPRAQVALAKHYSQRGQGASDSLLARHWLKKACRNNEMQACRKLMSYMNNTVATRIE